MGVGVDDNVATAAGRTFVTGRKRLKLARGALAATSVTHRRRDNDNARRRLLLSIRTD